MRRRSGLVACIAVTAAFLLVCAAIFVSDLVAPQSYEVLSERTTDADLASLPPTEAERVNINTASLDELCAIPGIGETRAADIIAYRETHGAFLSTADIMLVEGIGEGIYDNISDYITTGEETE